MKPGDTGVVTVKDHPLFGVACQLHKVVRNGTVIVKLTERDKRKLRGYSRGDVLHLPPGGFEVTADGKVPANHPG